jgi:aryl-alcohol dehydrogenase-like predicted oxidoreductase
VGKRRQHEWTKGMAKENAAKLAAWEKLCAKFKEKPADVALAWLLQNPAVTAPIIGPRTLEQLDGSLRALKIKLDAKRLAEIDKIFPGPGGAAPEAYAW